jgi:hypothetical protein
MIQRPDREIRIRQALTTLTTLTTLATPDRRGMGVDVVVDSRDVGLSRQNTFPRGTRPQDIRNAGIRA